VCELQQCTKVYKQHSVAIETKYVTCLGEIPQNEASLQRQRTAKVIRDGI